MFTIEEITLMNLYRGLTTTRPQMINNLKNVLPLFDEDEGFMKRSTEGVIRKLNAMSEEAYNNIDFSTALEV